MTLKLIVPSGEIDHIWMSEGDTLNIRIDAAEEVAYVVVQVIEVGAGAVRLGFLGDSPGDPLSRYAVLRALFGPDRPSE